LGQEGADRSPRGPARGRPRHPPGRRRSRTRDISGASGAGRPRSASPPQGPPAGTGPPARQPPSPEGCGRRRPCSPALLAPPGHPPVTAVGREKKKKKKKKLTPEPFRAIAAPHRVRWVYEWEHGEGLPNRAAAAGAWGSILCSRPSGSPTWGTSTRKAALPLPRNHQEAPVLQGRSS
jgi:hypothetical protein